MTAFYNFLQKVSRKLGRKVNGTWLFGHFGVKFAGAMERLLGCPFFPVGISQTEICVPFLKSHLWYRFQPFVTIFHYPASRGFSLVWLLAFTKSFACLVCREVGFSRGVNKPTTRETRHANDFVNAKSHAREKPLLAG